MLSTDNTRDSFGVEVVEQVICMQFSQCCIFRGSFGCHWKGLPLNQRGVGMRCNEGPNVCCWNSIYSQPIFIQNICVSRDSLEWTNEMFFSYMRPFRAATTGTSPSWVISLMYMNERVRRKLNRLIIHQYQVTVRSQYHEWQWKGFNSLILARHTHLGEPDNHFLM